MFENVKKVASKLTYAVPVIVFLGFVFYITAMTYTGTVQKTVEDTNWTFNSFKRLSNKFEKTLQDGIYNKYGFINLNGFTANMLGFNSLNTVQKLENGYLAWVRNFTVDAAEVTRKVSELKKFLVDRGIAFLFVVPPNKSSIYDVKFADGYKNESRNTLIRVINSVKEAKVNVLDMDSWFKEHKWHMEDVFFKTDHHWKPRAALMTAGCTMEWLHRQGLALFDRQKLQENNYRVEVLKNWVLGSQGRRVGKFYAGLDDFTIYKPKFETNYSYDFYLAIKKRWLFSNSLLNLSHIQNKDYFSQDGYAMYMHGDPEMRVTSNDKAINKKKVLILGDSFKSAVEYFLSTQFRTINTINTKIYSQEGSIAQYITETKPDIVLMYLNLGELVNKKQYIFGIAEYNQALAKTSSEEPYVLLGDFEIPSQGRNNNNFVTVGTNLKPEQSYTLTVDSTVVLHGESRHIQITLFDQTANKPVANHYFKVSKTDKQKWIFTVPNESDNYALYLYAGTEGHTSGNSVQVNNLVLRKGIFED